MRRVVIDTDVLVAAFMSDKGQSRALLNAVLDGHITMVASTALFIEYEAVLTRLNNLKRTGLTMADMIEALDLLAGIVEPAGLYYQWRPVAKDPDDDFVIETAVNAVADYIVSFNLKDIKAGAALFGIETIRPAELMRRLDNE